MRSSPPGIAARRGSATHKAAQLNHEQKLHTQEDLPPGDLQDAARDYYVRLIKEEGVFIPKDQIAEKDSLLAKGLDAAVRLTKLYRETLAPAIWPVLVEEQLTMDAGLDLPLRGTIDVLTADQWLPDLKTAEKSKGAKEADYSLQLTFYAGLVAQRTGAWPQRISLEILVNNKEPKLQSLPTTRGPADWTNLLLRIHLTLTQIQTGLFPPATPAPGSAAPSGAATFGPANIPSRGDNPMEATQDPAPAALAAVEPFTGEPETYPEATPVPQVPMMRSQTQFHTAVAVQRPRNLDKVVAAVLREAEFAGDAFYYSFPMGGKKIEGPSIGLAMAVAREWGNCAVPVEYYETLTEWVFNAHFVDLERGFTVSRVFRKKKGKGAFKKLEEDRAEDMTFQAAQSRAIRNVVLAGVPLWLTDQAKERAKDTVLKGISKEGLAAATDKALKFLSGYGITEERVLALWGKPKNEWTSEDIATLRGLASQLRDGQATPEQIFPEGPTPAPPPPAAGGHPPQLSGQEGAAGPDPGAMARPATGRPG
ncbi:MAG: PD-(D/E)XK nuclease family protein [Desulfobaccales bacterium]